MTTLPSVQEHVGIIQVLNGNRVSNMLVNATTGENTVFTAKGSVTVPNLRCDAGSANPDSVCICPASMNSSPFVPYPSGYRSAYFDELFSTATPAPLSEGTLRAVARYRQ